MADFLITDRRDADSQSFIHWPKPRDLIVHMFMHSPFDSFGTNVDRLHTEQCSD